jgi:hypothetical protein
MAITYTEGYTNNTSSTESITPIVIDQDSYYVTKYEDKNDPSLTGFYMENTTRMDDFAEGILITYKPQTTVGQTKKNLYPINKNPIKGSAKKLKVVAEERTRAISSTDDFYVAIACHNCAITFTWDSIEEIDENKLVADLKRALGSLKNSDGTGWRIAEMMRGYIDPTRNDVPSSDDDAA